MTSFLLSITFALKSASSCTLNISLHGTPVWIDAIRGEFNEFRPIWRKRKQMEVVDSLFIAIYLNQKKLVKPNKSIINIDLVIKVTYICILENKTDKIKPK